MTHVEETPRRWGEHIEESDAIFESLLEPEKQGEVSLAEMALAIRQELFDISAVIVPLHSLGQSVADSPGLASAVTRRIARARALGVAHLLLMQLALAGKERAVRELLTVNA